MKNSLMLIDGMSLAFRAFYALPPLTTSDGTYVNAVLGFLNMFYKLYEDERPAFLAAAFDLPEPTFRHKMFTEYKGTREAMPAELRTQIPILKEALLAMGVTVYEKAGYEADDILGTLARKADSEGLLCTIVSGDRDLWQVTTDRVCVKIPRTKAGKTETEVWYGSDVLSKIGVTPAQFVDVKALWGDTSDNIPGVPAVGEKTAVKLVKEYGSVENVLENAASVTPKRVSENLAKYAEQAVISKKLAAIDTDVPVDLEQLKVQTPDVYGENIYRLVKRLEFKSLYSKYSVAITNISSTTDRSSIMTSHTIGSHDEKAVLAAAERFAGCENAAYVIKYGEAFEGVSFASAEIGEYNISADFGDLDEKRVLGLCKAFFESNAKKLTWDAKSDMHILAGCGIALNNLEFDGMLAAYLLNNYGNKPDSASELLETCTSYKNELALQHIEHLYYDIEMPLIHILCSMEKIGICVDPVMLREYGNMLQKRIDAASTEIYNLTGENFNINSTQQLSAVLFDRMGLEPEGKRMKTGAYSTAAGTLERLAHQHPVIEHILEYRKLAKLKSTYADGLLQAMDSTTGRIYTTFNQAVASTGRLSSSDPNLQNIPVRTELGRELRKAFIPAPGFILADADYSQIELRVLAHMSGDETFKDAFANDKDIHAITAAEVFGVEEGDVTSEQRAAAKAVNFGIIYGQSAFGLSTELKIPVYEAENYIQSYFKRYPKIKSFMEETVKSAKTTSYTTTITGRRRTIPELSSQNRNTRAFGERAAMNMPIQGSAADIIKIAMIRVHRRLEAEGLRSRLILQVHDELMVEACEAELEAVKEILKSEMEQAVSMSVPLKADVGVGKNWYEAK